MDPDHYHCMSSIKRIRPFSFEKKIVHFLFIASSLTWIIGLAVSITKIKSCYVVWLDWITFGGVNC
ncbi:hypothetical protein Tsubulata_011622 [Turnera subulata]|uniref:Uncharacterized protein n=1 Tax=Turnera subulata TaxID=218843 RepID=A0A9Q0JM62_9ROSI|nr:hypothetical protein Tsubulata_011622 [Turnera subulata]